MPGTANRECCSIVPAAMFFWSVLFQLAVTMLVFFTGTTGTGFIAADLALLPHIWSGIVGCGFPFITTQRTRCIGVIKLHIRGASVLVFGCTDIFFCTYLDPGKETDDFILDMFQHVYEQLESLFLVLLFRVFCGITAQCPVLTDPLQSGDPSSNGQVYPA